MISMCICEKIIFCLIKVKRDQIHWMDQKNEILNRNVTFIKFCINTNAMELWGVGAGGCCVTISTKGGFDGSMNNINILIDQ